MRNSSAYNNGYGQLSPSRSQCGWLVAFVLVVVSGCAPKHDIASPSPFEEDDPAAQTKSVVEDKDDPSTSTEVVNLVSAPGEIRRSELDAVLANGPGDYLRGIEVEAVVKGQNSLHGWRVLRWDYVWADLRPDDVLLDVNGVRIVQPNDVSALWSVLAKIGRLEIRIERDDIPMTLLFEIIEDTQTSADSNDPSATGPGERGGSGVESEQ